MEKLKNIIPRSEKHNEDSKERRDGRVSSGPPNSLEIYTFQGNDIHSITYQAPLLTPESPGNKPIMP